MASIGEDGVPFPLSYGEEPEHFVPRGHGQPRDQVVKLVEKFALPQHLDGVELVVLDRGPAHVAQEAIERAYAAAMQDITGRCGLKPRACVGMFKEIEVCGFAGARPDAQVATGYSVERMAAAYERLVWVVANPRMTGIHDDGREFKLNGRAPTFIRIAWARECVCFYMDYGRSEVLLLAEGLDPRDSPHRQMFVAKSIAGSVAAAHLHVMIAREEFVDKPRRA